MTRPNKRSISELSGMLARPGQKPATIEELDDAIAEGAIASALGERAASAFRRKKRPKMHPMITGTMTSKGQTTVPKEVRKHLKLKPGDQITWWLEDNRVVVRARNRSIKELSGIFARPGQRTASLEEIQEAIDKGWAGEWSE